jgi:dephospho-CoA kinase
VPRPIVIGVTGGIGAGKSTLVDAFVHRGAVPFSADSAVHELYSDPVVLVEVRERWGDRVIGADGRVDRSAIASIVFNDEAERKWLEGLLHPLVAREWLRFVERERALPEPPEFVVAEVPLLFEAGLEDRYDAIVAITAPLPVRIERADARPDGKRLSAERAASQMPEEEKAARADFTFTNTGSFEDLDAFAGEVLEQLRARGVGSA